MLKDFTSDKSTLVQVNGLVPLGYKSLPEPIFAQIYVALWLYYAT